MRCRKCHKEIPDGSIFCLFCGRKQQLAERVKRRPNGAGCVYREAGKRKKPWRAVFYKKNLKISVGYFPTQTEALRALAEYSPPDSVIRPDLTLGDVYKLWSDSKYEALSRSGVDNNKAAWNHLSALSDVPISSLKTHDYQQILDRMKSTLSRSSCEKYRSLVSSLCQWAIQNDLLSQNYARYLVLPAQVKSDKREYFTDNEIATLLDHSDSQTAQIILVMIYTGMRINELFSLPVTAVHLDEKIAESRTVSYAIGGEKTEAGKNRTIVFHPRILPFIRAWVCTPGRVFLVEKTPGKMMDDGNFRKREYYPFLDSLGIARISPHKARHTFATRGAKAGIPPTVLQAILGHEKYETTADYYTHTDLAQIADGIELLE